MPLANRATIGNMSPEFGSTCAIFPIDDVTLDYLRLTGRATQQVALVEAYAKEQGLWHDPAREPRYSEDLELDLSTVVPSIAGPKRPQDRVALTEAKDCFRQALRDYVDDDSRRRRDASTRLAGVLPGQRLAGRRHRQDADDRAARARPRAAAGAGRASAVPVTLADGTRVRARPRRRRHRLDHVVHQHVEPVGHGRRRRCWPRRRSSAASRQAVGEDVARPGQQGRHGLLRQGRPHAVPGEARLQPGRLRLHDLHRELRPAARGGLGGRAGERPRGRLGALRQPQLRGPDQPGREDELPGLPAAGHRLRARRAPWTSTSRTSRSAPARTGSAVFLRDIWPSPAEVEAVVARRDQPGHVHQATTPTSSPATSAGSRCRRRPATPSPGTQASTYVRKPPYFDGHAGASRRRSPTSRARGCSPCSATR